MATKDQLRNRTVETREVVLAGGLVIKVKGLDRDEVRKATYEDFDESQITSKKDFDKFIQKVDRKRAENRMIAAALVDPEDMSEEDVEEWLKGAPSGDSVKVMTAIQELSGMSEEYPKSPIQKNARKPGRRS